MYEGFGFKKTGRRPRYYRDNDEDAILMTLEPLEAA
jgi:ribosomal-protein-alanine N-acetyltransferase